MLETIKQNYVICNTTAEAMALIASWRAEMATSNAQIRIN
jgi:hypothetical protein